MSSNCFFENKEFFVAAAMNFFLKKNFSNKKHDNEKAISTVRTLQRVIFMCKAPSVSNKIFKKKMLKPTEKISSSNLVKKPNL